MDHDIAFPRGPGGTPFLWKVSQILCSGMGARIFIFKAPTDFRSMTIRSRQLIMCGGRSEKRGKKCKWTLLREKPNGLIKSPKNVWKA